MTEQRLDSETVADGEAAPRNPWAGRFTARPDEMLQAYGSSIAQDLPLLPYDIRGSVAHARMLGRQGIVDEAESAATIAALEALAEDARAGRFHLRDEFEDVHMNVEAELERRIGSPARRLHTARSRNDQVVTDFRMLVRDGAQEAGAALRELQGALLDVAEQHVDTIMPGYTHLQVAQPVVLAHHLLAYREMAQRDRGRFRRVVETCSELPLGSGALAGSPYPLDRGAVAAELGFSTVSANSMDAVSDRDFLLEYLAAASIAMAHLSRLAEEIILWSTREFGFITLADAFSTGSSIMPQKKNPDVAELARGRAGSVFGQLMAALTMVKGLPLTYNRDLQNDKEPFLQSHATLIATTRIFAAMLPTISWNEARMREAAVAGYSLATDLADYLVKRGLPFREAHGVVGRLVGYAVRSGKEFNQLSLDEFRQFSPLFDGDAIAIDAEQSVDSRAVTGGTARAQVRLQLRAARAALEAESHRG